MASYKTVYILVEDSRETGFLRGDGITGQVCYSLKEACEKLLRRVWYYEPTYRQWIRQTWFEFVDERGERMVVDVTVDQFDPKLPAILFGAIENLPQYAYDEGEDSE